MSLRNPLIPFLLVLLAVAGRPVYAQTHWWFPSAVGYGAAGLGAGFVLTARAGADDDPLTTLPLVGFVTGAVAGGMTGRMADVQLSEGRELSALQRGALRLGTVMAGATAGALVSGVLIAPAERKVPGTDRTVFLTGVAAGAAVGIWSLYHWRSALEPLARAGIAPGPDGSWIVVVRGEW